MILFIYNWIPVSQHVNTILLNTFWRTNVLFEETCFCVLQLANAVLVALKTIHVTPGLDSADVRL